MVDKADESLERLISAARAFQPDAVQETDYFETRLMARIRERQTIQKTWAFWVWRLAPGFAVLAIVLGIASLVMDPSGPSSDAVTAVLSGNENQLIARYLIGG